MDILKKLIGFVNEKIDGTDFFIVETQKSNDGNRFRILIDGDKGFGIHDAADISRHVSARVDEEMPDAKLTYEISSPGADKPFILQRQYVKNTGRTLQVMLKDGKEITGKLLEVKENSILLEETTGKGKKAVTTQVPIDLENIKQAKVKITFK